MRCKKNTSENTFKEEKKNSTKFEPTFCCNTQENLLVGFLKMINSNSLNLQTILMVQHYQICDKLALFLYAC